MGNMTKYQILRKPEVIQITGFPRTTLQTRINDGLFCPPISLGDRAVGFVSYEVDKVVSAMICGSTKDEIKLLVAALMKQRETLRARS